MTRARPLTESHQMHPLRAGVIVLARVLGLAAAGYLIHALFVGSSTSPREHMVFWASAAGAAAGFGLSLHKRRTDAVQLTWHVLAVVAASTFLATLVVYRDPPLLRFGHAMALATGNAVTLAVATWLGRTALGPIRQNGPER